MRVILVYLLALLVPISFLYSPPVEKAGAVYVTKTMTIKHERKTPAYALFRQAQQVTQSHLQRMPSIEEQTLVPIENLSLAEVDPIKLNFNDVTAVSEMKLSKKELLAHANEQLSQMVHYGQDSLLLNKIQPNPFSDVKQTVPNAASIQGYFELSDGIGLVNQSISLRRVKEGQSIEVGQVDLKAGMYQIFVNSFDGELVAEIKDERGIVIGEDRKKIAGLVRQQNYFQGPQLKLGRPNSFGLNLRHVDDRKVEDKEFSAYLFSGNYTLKKTTDVYPNVARHSSTVAFIESNDDRTARTLSIRTVRDSSEIVLFSRNWVEGARQYISEKVQIQYMSDTEVIIGRVLVDGKPMAGAQVVVENQPGVEPYYLDQFLIPQVQQSTTSSNGYFIIPGVQPGSYQISAFIQNRFLGSQAYFVEPMIVSYQEIVTTNKAKISTVKSFDAFTGQSIKTEVQVPGVEEILTVGPVNAKYSDGTQSGLVEVINRPVSVDYVPYIYMLNQAKDYMHLPQLSEIFISHLQQNRKISEETSLFIGFVKMNKYEVSLGEENFDPRNIIYFNSAGELSVTPFENGGFAIFNVPLGTQEVIINNMDTHQVSTQAFYSKTSFIYLTHFTE